MASFRISLLEITKSKLDELSKSERMIAMKLLEDPQFFVSKSLVAIAEAADVSQPTVVRFCRNIGCEGFKDFKMRLAQDLAVEQAFTDAPHIDTHQLKTGTYIDHLSRTAIELINDAPRNLDLSILEDAVLEVSKAKNLMVYGLGGSSAIIAQEAENRFFRLGISCRSYSDSYIQRMTASTVNAGDVVLVISSTGRPRALTDCLDLANYYGAKTIAIAPKKSPVGSSAHYCLNISTDYPDVPYYHPSPVRYSQLFVLDCLADGVALRLGDKAKDTLKRIRSTIISLHGIVPKQPIGD